jgi:hypothetical protein
MVNIVMTKLPTAKTKAKYAHPNQFLYGITINYRQIKTLLIEKAMKIANPAAL